MDSGRLIGAVFFDLSKAFDTVDHNLLLHKLNSVGLTDDTLNWFQSYLTNRKQRTSVGDALSVAAPITVGVPQGSILEPLLFLIYVNDLPSCQLASEIILYADDTVNYYSSTNLSELEKAFNNLKEDLLLLPEPQAEQHSDREEPNQGGDDPMTAMRALLNTSKDGHVVNSANGVNKDDLHEKCMNFQAGQVSNFSQNWELLTSDQVILDAITHYHIEFELDRPIQSREPHNIRCSSNERNSDTVHLFTLLGFTIHLVKSILEPTQTIQFLGFEIDSVDMTVKLPPKLLIAQSPSFGRPTSTTLSTLPSFVEFKTGKGKPCNKELSKGKGKGPKLKEESPDVTIQIGLKVFRCNDEKLKEKRGKRLSVQVKCDANYKPLLDTAQRMWKTYHKDLCDEGTEYTLILEDSQEACFMFGSQAEFFQLNKYKEAIMKDYKRITSFLCTVEDLKGSEIDSEEENETSHHCVEPPPKKRTFDPTASTSTSGICDASSGAEPSRFNWSVPKKTRKMPAKRVPVATVTTQEESFEVEQEVFHQEVEAPVSTVCAASSSPALEESDVLKLQREMELLQVQLADLKEKLSEVETQELVRKNMPQEFAQYATTRMILDCTELFIQRPSAMLAQSETWSDYKHHNTWKLLVGVTPNGQVSFLSDLWGGRVSDRQITKESGILDLLEAGDNVMVDRGFDISNIVPDGVSINMPPFLAGREQMSAAETEETMSIASVRIYVERAIGRIKTYHTLDGTLPNTLSPYATQIATVCGLLTNFLPPLLPPAKQPHVLA
ncbi:putative RNA-directed DNA polymerase from transposon BS [Stylophora pistillata]|uniref:Putative RNA-directed DNA polymerase from transposon BS n=1 Tax=Stylophora pistillata TaxID=50429 RepID=A0A2B4RMW5_STYPI|nr:putative RNA-directed DNA polymerase from transposon BS [Stylophora pistillata]